MASPAVLSTRTLNRTLMARQMLDRRVAVPALEAVDHLVGLQAQEPRNPYVALWARLERFRPAELESLLEERLVVRTVVMRGTIHLVTASDCWSLRPLVQPVLDKELTLHRDHRGPLAHLDMTPILAAARVWLAEAPRTPTELRTLIAKSFPEAPAAAAAYALRNRLILVQVPPRGLWSRSGQVRSTTAEAWLGPSSARALRLEEVVARYLTAFGPATPGDVSTWCRLTGMREVLEGMRPSLRTFRDERGRELFDVTDGPIVDEEIHVPVRFLPEYDNVLLSHSDRSRVVPEGLDALDTDRLGLGNLLVDGFFAGFWTATNDFIGTTLTVELARRPTKRETAAVEAEGRRLLHFLHPEATTRDVRITRPAGGS